MEAERRAARAQMRLLPCCKLNPLRSVAVRTLCVFSSWVLVIVVGVVVYRSTLANKRQEIQLKCENRKEVGFACILLGLIGKQAADE
jgi:hypothetical protein